MFALGNRVRAADSAPVELSFVAPVGCPQRADVLRAIQAQLPAGFHSTTRLRAHGQVVAHSPSDFELILEFSAASGAHDARRVNSESCEAAADAAALLLALALVPSSGPPAPQPIAAAPATLARNEANVLGLVDSGLMPRLAVGGGLRLGFSLGAWRVQLSASQWGMGDAVRGAVRVQLDYWSVDLGVCYLASWSWLQVGPCASFEVGRMGGYAANVDGARPGGARVQAASVAAETRVRAVGPVWLMLDVGLEWIERRPQFEVADLGLVHRPEPFGLRVAFGPGLIW